ncbi:hypothetical protein [Halalkalicoccus subterraneus]|uniref:hypothetical protein n=1 Tax=Halalkalicoccus subterraneus TaxID=2675002 RepID=UPI0013CE99B7|nr:hypothetical protein [Halalkalicoccus subterraneus]
MSEDDPAYGSDGIENDDGRYGDTEDEKRSAGGESDGAENGDEGEDGSLGQDETDLE